MSGMNRTSRENIKVADEIIIDCFSHGEPLLGHPALWRIICKRGGRISYVSNAKSIQHYPDPKSARRAIRRHRQDIEPTTQEF